MKRLMNHAYFTGDGFAENFEHQLVRNIALEWEREQGEIIRRRRGKRVNHFFIIVHG